MNPVTGEMFATGRSFRRLRNLFAKYFTALGMRRAGFRPGFQHQVFSTDGSFVSGQQAAFGDAVNLRPAAPPLLAI